MMAFVRNGSIDPHLIDSLVTDVRLLGLAIAEEPAPPVVAYAQLRALVLYISMNGPRPARPDWVQIGHDDTVPEVGAWMTADTSAHGSAPDTVAFRLATMETRLDASDGRSEAVGRQCEDVGKHRDW